MSHSIGSTSQECGGVGLGEDGIRHDEDGEGADGGDVCDPSPTEWTLDYDGADLLGGNVRIFPSSSILYEYLIELTMGPRIGPIERNVAAAGMAKPRCLGVQISASKPLRTAEGAAPKTPCLLI